MVEFSTLIEILHWRALHQPDRRAYTFLIDGEEQTKHLTYGELDQKAQTIGSMLQDYGVVGDRALLLYPPGLEYIEAFLGCFYAGIIAVPTYSPDPTRLNRSLNRLRTIVQDAQPKVVLTTAATLSQVAELLTQFPDLEAIPWIVTDNMPKTMTRPMPVVGENTIAFLQYTSGSTSTPKGVIVNHKNIMENAANLGTGWEYTPDNISLTWLPTFHDLGLMDGIIQPLYTGFYSILMSPVSFLQRPYRWLQAISRYQVNYSAGPNFSYDLCVRKINAEQRKTLDLTSWNATLNAAEPVRKETMERFTEAFSPCGFRWQTFCPGYGLAEATLKVSGTSKADLVRFCRVDATLLKDHKIKEVSLDDPNAQAIVGCGRPNSEIFKTKVVIAHPDSLTQCALNEVGEIWFSGPGVAQGYWNRPEETKQIFQAYLTDTQAGPFLRTGDLGFLKDGELFITGRIKDLIIIDGTNHYPQDIELSVENTHPLLRPGCCAAFSINTNDKEQLVIVAEVERPKSSPPSVTPSPASLDTKAIIKAIRSTVAAEHGIQVYQVVLIKAGTIAKTSSGKIQRYSCRASFFAGNLEVVEELK